MHRFASLLVLAVGTLSSAVSTLRPAAPANALLPHHLTACGMTLMIDAKDAPRAEGSIWALSRKGHEAPEVLFTISLAGKTVCKAQVVGSRGFPTPYAPVLEAEYYPNGRTHERTLVLSSIKTDEPFRGMGCATALMNAMDEWLRTRYSADEVEVMYLLDHSRMPGFYEHRGWHTTAPLSWTILTKPLRPEGQGAALVSDGAVRLQAVAPQALAPQALAPQALAPQALAPQALPPPVRAEEAILYRRAPERAAAPPDDGVQLQSAADALTGVTAVAAIAAITAATASDEDVLSLIMTCATVAAVSLAMVGARDDAAVD